MDLSFSGSEGKWGKNGSWKMTKSKDDGRWKADINLKVTLNINNDHASNYVDALVLYKYKKISQEQLNMVRNKYIASRAGTIIHELVIHGLNDINDVLSCKNQVINDLQDNIDADKKGSVFRQVGIPQFYKIHQMLKTGIPGNEIKDDALNFVKKVL